ncbi:hypothetical protein Acsp03_58220 [Actinomadura sp. NBRC 104412]|nr:hypothetical protein Acsp03_58220 [Actinomadura sp. NBRC 104412]
MAVAAVVLGDHRPRAQVQGGEQAGGAVPDIVVGSADSFQVCTVCGLRSNARQIREMADCDIPVAACATGKAPESRRYRLWTRSTSKSTSHPRGTSFHTTPPWPVTFEKDGSHSTRA